MNPTFAQATPQAMQPGDAGHDIVLQAASAPLRDALGGRAVLEVERMDRVGDWAFVLGSMRGPSGGRPDLSGTRYADAAEQGAMSDVYVVLLKREPGDADGANAAVAAAGGTSGSDPAASPAAPADTAARDQAGISAGGKAPGDTAHAAGAADGPGATAFPAGGTWHVLDHAIGPGDVAWLDWPQKHAAPRVLFGF